MERQKKPWEEMTEEERQVVRESWKHTLPEEFDVFCIGDMIREECEGDLKVPGNLYISGFLDAFHLIVGGSLIVNDSIDSGNITVKGGSFICGGNIVAGDISVSNGDFISNGDIDVQDITVRDGNCIVLNGSINSYTINIDGTLDYYDIESNGHEIRAVSYICRFWEEEN